MSSFGNYQDTLLNHQTTQISHHTTNHSKLEDIKTKLDTVATNTANIKLTADSVNLNTDELEGKLDTINSTLSSGIGGLPASLTGSGNLKVSLQELGNEGSERLNVDVGSTVAQLPSALTGEGNLKVSIQEDFTHNLSTSAKQDTQITHLSNIDTGIDNLEACVGSNKVNVNISSGNITGFSTATLQGTTNGKLDTINSSLGDVATESTLQTIAEFNCDTTDVTITGGVNLPASLTGSGNLKVCIQELGNEGSERLNVDIGNAVAQLPSALSGSGRLKIENDFDGAVTNTHLSELGTAINSAKLDVNISSGNISGFSTASLQGGGLPSALSSDNLKVSLKETITVPVSNSTLTNLNDTINSNKLDVNISSGNISGFSTASLQGGGLPSALSSDNLKVSLKETITVPVSNSTLTNLNDAINSNKLDVNISSGNISGFSTASLQGGGLPSALSSDNLKVSLKESITVPVSNGALTELASALNSDKLDVNIANGGFGGAVTNSGLTALEACVGTDNSTGPSKCISIGGTNLLGGAIQEIAVDGDGHLQVDILSSALPSGASTELTSAVVATKTTLHTTSELKELLSGVTINSGALSSEFDFENYRHARFFGITTASVGTDFLVMGSNTSGGTYYIMGENLRSETIGSTHYIYSPHIENLPRYIKIINKSGSTNYIFTKLYVQLSEGRVAV